LKINIYKKLYKKIYKNLVYSIYKNNIYIADNIGFIYVINLNTGKIVWIKNYGVPLKSTIKVFGDKIFLTDQDNKIICLNISDGSKIWDIVSISSFIKSQNLLSLAVTKKGDLISINSAADIFKIRGNTGEIYWSRNTSDSLFAHDTDFFISSDIVITEDEIIFSAELSFFSYDIDNGNINWQNEVSSVGTPIVDRKNIFFISENGYFVILDKNNGEIISSTNILKILKKRKQETKITGFVMGSGKIYAVTLNGYLIVSSAFSGKAEYFKKIGDPITSAPIINNGKLYILTENSRIIGFN
jgi:outer membrane protein assembly factor BamB